MEEKVKAGTNPRWQKWIEANVYESLARYWCSRADLSFYTQPAFLGQF
jgi:hypothetical protein